jgi:tetrathionate reductase subunit B
MEDRRTFLKKGMGVVLLGAAGMEASQSALSLADTPSARYIMIIDLNKCNGCESCVIACKARNRTAPGQFLTKVAEVQPPPSYPFALHFKPLQCNQCEDPPCVPACPEKATYKLESGIVFTDWKLCKGLGNCVQACPYGARSLDPRFGGKADKCDFCLDRLEEGLPPACVEHCPPGARIFGDRERPTGQLAEYLKRTDLVTARPELRMKTNVLYGPVKRRGSK